LSRIAMAAALSVATDPYQPHLLRLPPPQEAGPLLQEVGQALSLVVIQGPLSLVCGDWQLRLPDLEALQGLLASKGLTLVQVQADQPETRVAAAALGLQLGTNTGGPRNPDVAPAAPALTVHQGPLRSGEHLQVEGSVLLLGDVNPGAQISAVRHVLVWGRLRGVAHAGRGGDDQATIVALQMRPLQLRIANAVARGPDEVPIAGLCEAARLVNGEICIDPASPRWPLPGIPPLGLNVDFSPSAL
jgi:septum site-determining protein MinC